MHVATSLQSLAESIRKGSQQDYIAFLQKTADKINEQSYKHAPRVAWRAVKKLASCAKNSKWKRTRNIPLIYDSEGAPASSLEEVAHIHLEHFAQVKEDLVTWNLCFRLFRDIAHLF